MLRPALPIKVALVCYAIFSLPYISMALQGGSEAQAGEEDHEEDNSPQERGLRLTDATSNYAFPIDTKNLNLFSPAEQEVSYFRNFTMVGRASQGFNATQWELGSHLNRSSTALEQRSDGDIGDFILKAVGAGAAVSIFIHYLCITWSHHCATYVGKNIGAFWTGVAATGGAAAVQAQSATAAFTTVLNHDGNPPPIWSCYQATTANGQVAGYFSHCIAQGDGFCDLQCGQSRPEIVQGIEPITIPQD